MKKIITTFGIDKDLHFEFKKAVLLNKESMTDALIRFIKSYVKKTKTRA